MIENQNELEFIKKKQRLILENFDDNNKKYFLNLVSNSTESTNQSSEWASYSMLFLSHLDWETSYYFMDLQEKFINHEIDFKEFDQSINKQRSLNFDSTLMLANNKIVLTPHIKSLDFGLLIEGLLYICDDFHVICEDFQDKNIDLESFETAEQCFRHSVKEIYIELQAMLEE